LKIDHAPAEINEQGEYTELSLMGRKRNKTKQGVVEMGKGKGKTEREEVRKITYLPL
jgi:hypothetical protein